jgi:hypothetical protein
MKKFGFFRIDYYLQGQLELVFGHIPEQYTIKQAWHLRIGSGYLDPKADAIDVEPAIFDHDVFVI